MPRHVVVSPEEELAAFYGGADPVAASGATTRRPSAPLPVATAAPGPSAERLPAPVKPSPEPVAPSPTPVAPKPGLPSAAPLAPRPAPAAPVTTGADPVLAALASLIIPGLGQLLAGQGAKGVVLLIVGMLSCGMGGLLNLVAAVDAYLIAQRKRRGESVQDWQFF